MGAVVLGCGPGTPSTNRNGALPTSAAVALANGIPNIGEMPYICENKADTCPESC